MVREGYYEAELGTLVGQATALLELCGGRIRGVTTRGADVEGTYTIDESRRMVCYEIDVHMPVNFQAVTGLTTGDQPRTVRIRGEAAPSDGATRFSCCLAGRAVDIALRHIGPLDEAGQPQGDASRCHEPFFSATSSAPTASGETC